MDPPSQGHRWTLIFRFSHILYIYNLFFKWLTCSSLMWVKVENPWHFKGFESKERPNQFLRKVSVSSICCMASTKLTFIFMCSFNSCFDSFPEINWPGILTFMGIVTKWDFKWNSFQFRCGFYHMTTHSISYLLKGQKNGTIKDSWTEHELGCLVKDFIIYMFICLFLNFKSVSSNKYDSWAIYFLQSLFKKHPVSIKSQSKA